MTCVTCSTSGCNGEPCDRLERLLPQMTGCRELVMASTGIGATITLADLREAQPDEFHFNDLSIRDNRMLNDRYVYGMKFKDMARKWGVKQNTLRPRLSRLRMRLRTISAYK